MARWEAVQWRFGTKSLPWWLRRKSSNAYDVIIVGAGPAGFAAAEVVLTMPSFHAMKRGTSANARARCSGLATDKKVLVVPAEAETVCAIFTRYLELGSVRALAGP
jgi:hypothetical protein